MLEKEVRQNIKGLVDLLEENDAMNIKLIDMTSTALMVDCFVIVNGNSDTHMAALRDYAVQYFKKNKIPMVSFDRGKGYNWVVVDAGYVVLHIFNERGREFYDLEGLWAENKEYKL